MQHTAVDADAKLLQQPDSRAGFVAFKRRLQVPHGGLRLSGHPRPKTGLKKAVGQCPFTFAVEANLPQNGLFKGHQTVVLQSMPRTHGNRLVVPFANIEDLVKRPRRFRWLALHRKQHASLGIQQVRTIHGVPNLASALKSPSEARCTCG